MSAHILLNLLNESFYHFYATNLINALLQEHEC